MGLTPERLGANCHDRKVSDAQSLRSQTANWNFIPHVPLTISRVIFGTDLSSLRMQADGRGCLMCQLLGDTRHLYVKLSVCVVFLLHNPECTLQLRRSTKIIHIAKDTQGG